MKTTLLPLLALGLTVSTGTLCAAERSTETPRENTTDALESKLEAARDRLEEAAHDVAQLSAEIGLPVMDRVMAFSEGPRRAIIGVQLDPASGKDGAVVREVSPGGPAAEAGIQAKDVIVMVNGTEVKGDAAAHEVTRLMRRVEPDSHVNLRVHRNGRDRDVVVIARAADFAVPPLPPLPPMPPEPGAPDTSENAFFTANTFDPGPTFMRAFGGEYADMQLASLTPQLSRYFGTSEGILVVRAPKEEELKLEDGDVILSIDGRKPTTGSHATRILRSYQPGETVSMKVMRQKKPVNLEVTLPERKGLSPAVRSYRTEEPS